MSTPPSIRQKGFGSGAFQPARFVPLKIGLRFGAGVSVADAATNVSKNAKAVANRLKARGKFFMGKVGCIVQTIEWRMPSRPSWVRWLRNHAGRRDTPPRRETPPADQAR